MNVSKTILTFLILIAVVQFCVGQASPSAARLTDEFGSINCEEVLGRTDSFMVEIVNDPMAIGYAVIYPEKNALQNAFKRESWITGNINFRKFYKDRLLIVRGEERDEFQVQFWLVPTGAEKPKFNEGKWTYFDKGLSKAFNFSSKFIDSSCPANILDYYVSFLADNPSTRGHIVVFDIPRSERQKEIESWLKAFTHDGRLTRDRFKFFFAKKSGFFSNTELWIVPAKKK